MIELIDDALKIGKRKYIEVWDSRYSILGDIHGDIESLERILKLAYRPAIFLGDYGDRGERQIEVYERILKGYIDGEFILLRGNHETTSAFPHDLPYRLRRFDNWEDVYEELKKFWENLPWFALIGGSVFAAHGGIYTKGCRIVEEGINLRELMHDEAFLEMIWNDPWEKEGCDYNFERGTGYFFGKKATKKFLDDLDLKAVVRGHQPYKVLKAEQNGMVVTVGSTGVYGTNYAFLNVDGDIENGFQIVGRYGRILTP